MLDFLRTEHLSLEDLDEARVAEIKSLFEYFLLKYPAFDYCWDTLRCGLALHVFNNRLSVKKDKGTAGWNAGVLGKERCAKE